jgi:hypothetical protein
MFGIVAACVGTAALGCPGRAVPGRVDLIRNAGIANAGILEDGKIRFTYDPKWDAVKRQSPPSFARLDSRGRLSLRGSCSRGRLSLHDLRNIARSFPWAKPAYNKRERTPPSFARLDSRGRLSLRNPRAAVPTWVMSDSRGRPSLRELGRRCGGLYASF